MTMTKIPKQPRYVRSTTFALDALYIRNVDSFPINVQKVCMDFGIKLKKYSTLAKKNNVTVDQIGEAYKTKLGYIFRNDKGKYFIAYNDTLPEGLIRFTLAHELGHFFLNHLEDFEETELMYNSLVPYSEEHECLEKEANCFARNFLSPSDIAKLVGDEINAIQSIFGLTYKASTVRLNSINLDNRNSSVLKRINMTNKNQILSYLSQINFKYSNLYHCDDCNAEFSFQDAKYCSICGQQNLWKITLGSLPIFREFGGTEMKYSKIETNAAGTPITCPVCEYDELNDDFNYCPICSTYIHNVCIGDDFYDSYGNHEPYHFRPKNGCRGNLDGNFRFCPTCGEKTSFFQQELLTDWKTATKNTNTFKFETNPFEVNPFE